MENLKTTKNQLSSSTFNKPYKSHPSYGKLLILISFVSLWIIILNSCQQFLTPVDGSYLSKFTSSSDLNQENVRNQQQQQQQQQLDASNKEITQDAYHVETGQDSTPVPSHVVHEKEFKSAAARVQIDCSRDKTLISVNFTRAFNGILAVGKLETSKCRIDGDGKLHYKLAIAHNETQCDTQWDEANKSISNTLLIRFHPSLETGADIAKNLMCRLTVGEVIVGKKPSKLASSNNDNQSSDPTSSSVITTNAKPLKFKSNPKMTSLPKPSKP